MLAFRRVAVDRVAIGGRWADRDLAEADFGSVVAEWAATEQEYLASRERERASYASRCRVAEIMVTPLGAGRRTPMVAVDEVRFPDGRIERVDVGEGATRVAEEAVKRYPIDNRRPAQPTFDDWWSKNSTKVVTWVGQFYESGHNPRTIDVDALTWDYGLPVEPILAALDSLLAEGWRLVHVSEDRGLYTNPDVVVNDSYPTRVRYLVER